MYGEMNEIVCIIQWGIAIAVFACITTTFVLLLWYRERKRRNMTRGTVTPETYSRRGRNMGISMDTKRVSEKHPELFDDVELIEKFVVEEK